MARWRRPPLLRRAWAGLLLATLATALQAQESAAMASAAEPQDDGLPLRMTLGTARPVAIARRLDSMVAGTLAVTAPQRQVALDGRPSDSPPPRAASWHSGLGLTLSGGDRIGVRRADGGTQLVWRRQF